MAANDEIIEQTPAQVDAPVGELDLWAASVGSCSVIRIVVSVATVRLQL